MKTIFHLESQVFQSLAHPKRLEILHLLSHEEMSVSAMVEMTGLTQANVSQHLMVLRKLGLVTCTKVAQQRVYSLASQAVKQVSDAMRTVLLEQYGTSKIEELNRLHLFTDPVCGMDVTAHSAAASLTHNGKRYYFCALGCERKFTAHPEHFIGTENGVHI